MLLLIYRSTVIVWFMLRIKIIVVVRVRPFVSLCVRIRATTNIEVKARGASERNGNRRRIENIQSKRTSNINIHIKGTRLFRSKSNINRDNNRTMHDVCNIGNDIQNTI